MWRGVLVASAAICVLGGCAAVPNEVNHAAASAMRYSGLTQDAMRRDPALAAAIAGISRSDEHRYIQGVLAHLPADMDGCLVIELAGVDDAGASTPMILTLFVSGDSLGFLSNFQLDDEGMFPPAGREWFAASWPADGDTDALLPENPEELLPEQGVSDDQSSSGAVLILTLVNRQQAISVAIWDTLEAAPPSERLVRYLPAGVQARLRAAPARRAQPLAGSWRCADACVD